MSANVFANGMEVSGKASDNKSIAAMPDVCMSPPPPPAGPVPIPYPNTAMASDTADGTKTVTVPGTRTVKTMVLASALSVSRSRILARHPTAARASGEVPVRWPRSSRSTASYQWQGCIRLNNVDI